MKASGGLSPPCLPYLKSRSRTKTKPWINVDSKRSVFGTGAMVMGVARHPFRSHLMGSLAIEQHCGLLCLRLRVIHRFDGLSTRFRWGRLFPHRKQRCAVVRTNLVMSNCRSRQSQQAQKQSSGWGETHLRFDCNILSLMHQVPLDRFASYLASNGNEE